MRKIADILNLIEEWTLVMALLGLAFLAFVQVICRYALGFSFTWMEELARYLGVFIAFLGASLGVKYGTHFSMTLVYERISSDRIRHVLQILVNLISATLFMIVAWYGLEQTLTLRQYGALTSALELPKYWAYLPIPFFSVFISLRFFRLFLKHAAGFARNEPFTMVGGGK